MQPFAADLDSLALPKDLTLCSKTRPFVLDQVWQWCGSSQQTNMTVTQGSSPHTSELDSGSLQQSSRPWTRLSPMLLGVWTAWVHKKWTVLHQFKTKAKTQECFSPQFLRPLLFLASIIEVCGSHKMWPSTAYLDSVSKNLTLLSISWLFQQRHCTTGPGLQLTLSLSQQTWLLQNQTLCLGGAWPDWPVATAVFACSHMCPLQWLKVFAGRCGAGKEKFNFHHALTQHHGMHL
jgi:hypothetical protein